MELNNLILLIVIALVFLLAIERTERKRRWITILGIALPAFLLYRWAIYREQTREALIAVGIASGIFLVYWLIYARRNPPKSSDDEIRVIGMDE